MPGNLCGIELLQVLHEYRSGTNTAIGLNQSTTYQKESVMPITSADPRFVTKTMHAYLDYPVAVSLIALPFALGLDRSQSTAAVAF